MESPKQNLSRRQLLGTAGVALGAAALASKAQAQGTMAATPSTATTGTMSKPSSGDIALLKAALQVEQLQSAFYAQVLGAQQTRAYLPTRLLDAVTELSTIEAAHVTAISSVLAGAGSEAPTTAFKFPYAAFVSYIEVAWLGYTFEEIALGAHLYALERIELDSVRRAVVGIYGADARHAAFLRKMSGYSIAPRYFEGKLTPSQVSTLLAPYMA